MYRTLARYNYRDTDDVSFYADLFRPGQGFLQKENKDH